MLFLIEYDRSSGEIVKKNIFDESQRDKAENERLDLELSLNRKGIKHEVVILEASTEAALQLTHRRYFEDIKTLAKSTQ